jgi:hypothetical protein
MCCDWLVLKEWKSVWIYRSDVSLAKVLSICYVICRKCAQRAVKEPETEEVTSQEKKVLTDEEEKKRADSLWTGMVVVTDQSFGLTFGQLNIVGLMKAK